MTAYVISTKTYGFSRKNRHTASTSRSKSVIFVRSWCTTTKSTSTRSVSKTSGGFKVTSNCSTRYKNYSHSLPIQRGRQK